MEIKVYDIVTSDKLKKEVREVKILYDRVGIGMKVHSMSIRVANDDPLRRTRQVLSSKSAGVYEVCTVAVWKGGMKGGKRSREQSSYLSFKRFTAWSSTTEHS